MNRDAVLLAVLALGGMTALGVVNAIRRARARVARALALMDQVPGRVPQQRSENTETSAGRRLDRDAPPTTDDHEETPA